MADVTGFLVAIVALGFLLQAGWHALGLIRVLRTPLRSTARAGQQGDARSEEVVVAAFGRVHAPDPAPSPMTRTPCLGYRLEVKACSAGGRGSTGDLLEIHTEPGGAVFSIDDGSGPVAIDLRAGRVQAPWAETVVSAGAPFGRIRDGTAECPQMTVGHYTLEFDGLSDDVRTWRGIERVVVVERVIPPCEQLYVCGTLRDGVFRGEDLRSLILRDEAPEQVRAAYVRCVLLALAATTLCALLAWGLMAI